MQRVTKSAFTLVEILIVVVILGILAAVVVPRFVGAVEEASVGTTQSELHKLRRAVDVYRVRNGDSLPLVNAGDGTWGDLISGDGSYLKEAPLNPYVGGDNQKTILIRDTPDEEFQSEYAWVYSSATGDVWAGGFDENDQPLPVP